MKAHWAGYFEQLYQADPPAVELDVRGVTITVADPPINWSLWRILGYRWSDFVSNERLLRETQMRFVSFIVRVHQLRLYGHVARFPDADPAHHLLSAREPREWRRPMGDTCLVDAAG